MADPPVVAAGGALTYTLLIMNDMLGGADPGATVLLTDALPAHGVKVISTIISAMWPSTMR